MSSIDTVLLLSLYNSSMGTDDPALFVEVMLSILLVVWCILPFIGPVDLRGKRATSEFEVQPKASPSAPRQSQTEGKANAKRPDLRVLPPGLSNGHHPI